MNKVELLGRMTKDPDVRYTTQGLAVARFTLAINRRKKEDGADFISCKAFGKTGELLEKYIHKGDQLCVCGRIETGSYDDKDGKKVYTFEVVADEIHFVGGKREGEKPVEKPAEQERFEDAKADDLHFDLLF